MSLHKKKSFLWYCHYHCGFYGPWRDDVTRCLGCDHDRCPTCRIEFADRPRTIAWPNANNPVPTSHAAPVHDTLGEPRSTGLTSELGSLSICLSAEVQTTRSALIDPARLLQSNEDPTSHHAPKRKAPVPKQVGYPSGSNRTAGHVYETTPINARILPTTEIFDPYTCSGEQLVLGLYEIWAQGQTGNRSHGVKASSNKRRPEGPPPLNSPSSNKKVRIGNAQTRKGKVTESENDESDPEQPRSQHKTPSLTNSEPKRPFACPFYKHDRSRYGGENGCAGYSTRNFESMRRVCPSLRLFFYSLQVAYNRD